MTITCNVCGYDQNPDGLEFCDACGAELTYTTVPTSPSIFPLTSEPHILDPLETNPTVKISPSTSESIIPSNPPETFTTSTDNVTATAKLIAKTPNAPISEFLIENYAIIGIFDPDTGPVDVDLEYFLGNETVSRQHGEIYFENNQWKIKDLGSTNGIFIKKAGQNRFNARITTPEILDNGDEIAIAKIRFTFTTIN
ncbi:FraH-related protein [Geminocystis sp. NIES-3708]|uniref:FHA domain-containing protein n=1 Tax=Geminocystis sp. NIES-3708 TaxID=1615909 RepID=UPI0005FC3FEE|nr:FHA domain-containing protein [Geminocystis sp. NIES-3708]BAQ60132.1 FraH-related protein [Geminocystis sp. NIES-3708]